MLEKHNHIKDIFERHANGTATADETKALYELAEDLPNEQLMPILEAIASNTGPDTSVPPYHWENMFSSILEKAHNQQTPAKIIPMQRNRLRWWAAAAVLVIGL